MNNERRFTRTALIAALGLFTVGVPQYRSQAAVPSATTGLIAFVRDGGPPESGIYTIAPTGSDLSD